MLENRESRLFAAVVALLLVAATAWAGGEPWKEKPFNQWDDTDLQKIFTASPWSKVLLVENMWEDVKEPGKAGGASKGGDAGGGEVGEGTRGAGAVFNVYWLSSRTLRGAVAQKGVLHQGRSESDAEKYVAEPQEQYQVVIQGKDMRAFAAKDEAAYASLAGLQLKSNKARLAPSEVKYERTPDGKIEAAIFLFPKKTASGEATIAPNEKTAEFSCKVGKSTIKVIFEPQKMTDKQGTDL